MYLNQNVSVYCTDTEKTNKARIVRMHSKGIDVELNDIILRFLKSKPNLYICNYSGLEFVIKI
tara:strand:- start:120 stop:308 length:189 start_codon:yes stop_codon:yes gene_type:complete